MPSPFPGMDPYLEISHKWPGVQMLLIVQYVEVLNRQLRPRYVAEIEERVYPTPDADGETHERRVEIRATDTKQLVTVIELLSPANKVVGSEGRRSFLAKRREVTSSPAHWVEIDLLRHGETLSLRRGLTAHEYFVHVSPAEMRPTDRVWPIRLENRLPVISIPLRAPDPDTTLDLQAALDTIYDRGAYDLKLDYTTDPDPALPPELAKWAKKLLKAKKLR